MKTITLTPPERKSNSTEIIVGDEAVLSLKKIVERKKPDHIVLLYDRGVTDIAKYIDKLLPNSLAIGVPSGDATKSLETVEKVCSKMLEANCTRHTLLVCVGGGMLTDLGGFIASVFMRGVSCVLIPTTLLGMVDAAIGGKTAVNSGGRKNMIGTVTHPYAVIADTGLLQDLPDAQLSEGLVEIIKIAAILDAGFFTWLEKNWDAILSRDEEKLAECVERAIALKVKTVEKDEHDHDVRLLLNFGHTVGHAVEALSKYKISHGAAVAIGMAEEMKAAGFKAVSKVTGMLQALGLSTEIPKKFSKDALWQAMLTDKKTSRGKVRMAVPKVLGKGEVQELKETQFKSLS